MISFSECNKDIYDSLCSSLIQKGLVLNDSIEDVQTLNSVSNNYSINIIKHNDEYGVFISFEKNNYIFNVSEMVEYESGNIRVSEIHGDTTKTEQESMIIAQLETVLRNFTSLTTVEYCRNIHTLWEQKYKQTINDPDIKQKRIEFYLKRFNLASIDRFPPDLRLWLGLD